MTDICHACAVKITGPRPDDGSCVTMSMQVCMVCGTEQGCASLLDYWLTLKDGKIVRAKFRVWD